MDKKGGQQRFLVCCIGGFRNGWNSLSLVVTLEYEVLMEHWLWDRFCDIECKASKDICEILTYGMSWLDLTKTPPGREHLKNFQKNVFWCFLIKPVLPFNVPRGQMCLIKGPIWQSFFQPTFVLYFKLCFSIEIHITFQIWMHFA